jgi:ribosome-binding factor A
MPNERKNTNRIQRVNSLLQQALGPIIHPYVENYKGLVTISKVEASRDLKWAKVWISIIAGEDAKILAALQKNIYDIQGEVIRLLAMKVIPRVQFFLDTSPRYAQHIDEIIHKIHEEEETEEK